MEEKELYGAAGAPFGKPCQNRRMETPRPFIEEESLPIARTRFFAAVEACRHREADASNDQRDDMTFIMDEMQIPKDLPEDFKEVISNEINHALDLTDGLPDRERDEYLWKEAFEDAWGAISEALETRERKRLKKTI